MGTQVQGYYGRRARGSTAVRTALSTSREHSCQNSSQHLAGAQLSEQLSAPRGSIAVRTALSTSWEHSCQNSSQHGSIIGDLHHLLDSLRPMAPSTGDYHHHINPRCIDAARCARGLADGVHPRSEGRPLHLHRGQSRESEQSKAFGVRGKGKR